jgi:hypothetical protein
MMFDSVLMPALPADLDAACAPDVALLPLHGDARCLWPQEELLVAVIEQARRDVLHPSTRPGTRRAAVRWFLCSDPRTPFAFEWACGVLGLHAGYVRRQLGLDILAARRARLYLPRYRVPGGAVRRRVPLGLIRSAAG